MRILMVLVRHPGGPASGRQRAIHSLLRSLADLGHAVHVVAISEDGPDPELPDGMTFETLPPPHTGRVLGNIACRAIPARLSLNECLCWSPHLAQAIRRITRAEAADVVIADTLRAYPLATAPGLPVVADLDDLLSDRYESIARAPGPATGTALGSYRRRLPPLLRSAAARAATAALRVESRLTARREVQIAREAAAVCLVSGIEAEELAARAGRPVFWTPPAVPALPQLNTIANAPGWRAAYVGGLDFGPNLQAIRWFRSEVIPLLLEMSRGAFRLSVIGHCPAHVRTELQHPAIEFLGYVEYPELVLSRARAFVAPVVSGTGLKIKVIDAMARGMPVVATAKAVEGLAVKDRIHVHIADTPVEFAGRLQETADDGEAAAALGQAGRTHVASYFSPARAAAGWQSAIASVQVREISLGGDTVRREKRCSGAER